MCNQKLPTKPFGVHWVCCRPCWNLSNTSAERCRSCKDWALAAEISANLDCKDYCMAMLNIPSELTFVKEKLEVAQIMFNKKDNDSTRLRLVQVSSCQKHQKASISTEFEEHPSWEVEPSFPVNVVPDGKAGKRLHLPHMWVRMSSIFAVFEIYDDIW